MGKELDSAPGRLSLQSLVTCAGGALLLASLWLFGCRGQGSRPEPTQEPLEPEIAALADGAELVVVGNVTRSTSRWVGKKIFTTYEIEPLRVIKGSVPTGRLEVLLLGGRVGVIAQEATHQARLHQDEISLLFLTSPAPGDTQGGMRLLSERGSVPLVLPGEPRSRLDNNRRITRFLDSVQAHVEERR